MRTMSLPIALGPPPTHMHVSGAAEATFTAVCAIPLAAALILAVRELSRRHDLFPLLCLVGGASGALLIEPLLDANGGVWWPAGGWRAYTLAQIPIPVLVPCVYPWLLGGQGYLALKAFNRGADSRTLWRLIAAFAVIDVVLETPGLWLHTYTYFGAQALDFWGLPLWYVPLNAVGPFMAGAMLYLLRPRFSGSRTPLLLGVFPMSFAVVYFGAGFPMWLSLQSNWPVFAATGAGLATFLLAYLMVSAILAATGHGPISGRSEPATLPQPVPIGGTTSGT